MPTTRPTAAPDAANLAIVRGCLSSEPRLRQLPSGSSLLQLEITTPASDGAPAASVPVVWFDPPPNCGLDTDTPPGTELIAVGSVRRRFFRVGGATASRTEVVASSVVPRRRARRVTQLVESARSALAADPWET